MKAGPCTSGLAMRTCAWATRPLCSGIGNGGGASAFSHSSVHALRSMRAGLPVSERDRMVSYVHERFGRMIDTHTADGLAVAQPWRLPGVPMIVLETALPIKFAGAVVEALGREPNRPARFEGIENLPRRVTVLPADAGAVKQFIAAHCQ